MRWEMPVPQLQPGSGHLHLVLLPDLLVQPECLPRAQASSPIRCWGSCVSVLFTGGGEKGAPDGLKSTVGFPQEGMATKHAAE